ncbi:hypothetical protein [Microbacterium sp. LWH11-1.2]|uniref:hypothetical protein n=1 Tax=Microbacterium sp. LWH11-1.2 TaxID=3135258 RepID=UPI003139DFF7
MTITLKLSGDDVTGKFDSELTSFSPLIVADTLSGVPWFKVTSTTATKIIGKSPLGSPATTYFGFAFRKTGNPASSQVFLHPFTSAGATSFRLRLSSTGTIILDGASTNSLDTSAVLSNNTTYAFVGSISATVATVAIYAADGTTVIDTITATNTFGLVDNWRMGQIGTTPALPDWSFRMLLVGDTAITAADVLATPTTLGTPRIAVLSDSNGYENGAGPTHYFSAFDVNFDTRNFYYGGVGGKRIAVADLTGKTAANNVADAQAWLGTIDTWIIALGTNDRPQVDATINADIDTLLTAIGAGPKIVWIGLTSKATASADDIRVNGLIQAKLTARGNATFADWNTYIRAIDGGSNPSTYWLTTDSTHMTAAGYTERAAFVAAQLVTTVNVSASGALALVGAATRTITVARTASGSLTLSGDASRTVTVGRTASGTLALAGTAEHATTVTRTAAGVLELSGSASTTGSTDRTADGLLTIQGTATASVTITRTAQGSLGLGGIGSVTYQIVRTALGILALTGVGVTAARVLPDRLTLTEVVVNHTLTPVTVSHTLEDAS